MQRGAIASVYEVAARRVSSPIAASFEEVWRGPDLSARLSRGRGPNRRGGGVDGRASDTMSASRASQCPVLHPHSPMRAPILAAMLLLTSSLGAQSAPTALYADPPRDAQHPARNEVLHLPTHGVQVNGLAFLAAGARRHPTFVFLHGLPGNEKGHDLAQTMRRAGWNVVTFNYRGSWGSPGSFAFDHTVEDAEAVLAYLRDTANARTLGVDTNHIVVGGHSMGGWVAATIASRDARLRGAVLISTADMGVV